MNKSLRVIISSFMVCGIVSASEYRCLEKLPPIDSLICYVQSFPSLMALAYKNMRVGDTIYGDARVRTVSVARYEQTGLGLKQVTPGYALSICKTTNNGKEIEFESLHGILIAVGVGLMSIGRSLPVDVANTLQKINLDNNRLASFREVQQKVLDACPFLVGFSARHNNFSGVFSIFHKKLQICDVSHNRFTSVGDVQLSATSILNLECNYIGDVDPYADYVIAWLTKKDDNLIDGKVPCSDNEWQNELPDGLWIDTSPVGNRDASSPVYNDCGIFPVSSNLMDEDIQFP